MDLHVFKVRDARNRAYVLDNTGNKLFYGTIYQCGKFVDYMLKGEAHEEKSSSAGGRAPDPAGQR